MRKRLAFALLCVLGLSAIPPAVATVIPEKDWEYERLDDDHVVIHNSDQSRYPSAIDPETAGDITVPATLRSMQVVSIGEKAFYNCTNLTSVTIPEGVTNIADNAFYGCTSLTNVVFPASLKSIGAYGFCHCRKLDAVQFECASLAIGKYAFQDCSSVSAFGFTGDALTIDEYAFSGCSGVLGVWLSAKVINVGKHVFSGCAGMQDVWLSANVVNVGRASFGCYPNAGTACVALTNVVIEADSSSTLDEYAFSSCTALRYVELPCSLTDISTNAFSKCSSLECVVFPTNLTHIAYQAFDSCMSLRSVDFFNGLTSIDAQAFYGCTAVTNLVFPQSLTSIGARAFEQCEGLELVMFTEGATNAASAVTIGERAFYRCSAITNVVLPQALTSLGERAFSQCDALVRVNLPTNLAEIATSTFEDCAALPTIDLPMSLASIGNTAFFGCTNLTDFLIPTNNVVAIGTKAFNNTKYWEEQPDGLVVNNGYILGFKGNPTSVVMPDSCKAIPVGMFEGMTTLRAVSVPDGVTTVGARAFAGSGITNIAFAGVTTLGGSAFEGCSSLASAVLSSGLTAIPGSAFKDCAALRAIAIPDKVTSIGEYAFYNCTSLTNVTGASGVRQVGDYAFAQCPALQPFEFPNDVAYGDHVYQGCTWKEHVLFPTVGTLKDEYPATYAEIKSVVFSSGMSIITNGACAGCASLQYVRIPDGVTAIGARAFDGCSALTSVVMSASVASVETNSFANCSGIRSVVVSGKFAMRELFPASYADLPDIAFVSGETSLCTNFLAGCSSLAVIDLPTSVATIGSYAFQDCRGLSAIALPKGVVTIPEGACQNCTGLTYVRIPDDVTAIGALAFDGCTSLTSVVMSASVASVATNSFAGCSGIKSATVSGVIPVAHVFPEMYRGMESLGIAEGATALCGGLFAGCAALAAVEIPWRVTSIGERAFYCCSNLTGSIVIPEYVTSIGDEAFGKCFGLKSVDYLCDMPDDVSDDVYAGTRGALMSKVLPQYASWQTATNSANAFVLPSKWKERPIVWWATVQSKLATVRFSNNDNLGGGKKLCYLANAGRQILALPEEPEREGYEFLGWFTAPYGGTEIEEGVDVGESVTYYAHWKKDDEDIPTEYDFSRANTYNGYLTEDEAVVGSVQIKFAKGKWNKSEEETNAVATATVQILGEGKVTAKGTLHEDGIGELTHAKSEREMELIVEDANMLSGTFDGYGIVAYRDLFASTLYDDRVHGNAMLEDVRGNYVVVLAADEGDAGYAALSVSVGAKGKSKVTGVMPDGTRVSATAQLSIAKADDTAEDVGYLPVVVPLYAKKGGFGFALSFEPNEGQSRTVQASGVSDWIADKSGTVIPLSAIGVQSAAGLVAGVHGFVADLSMLEIEGVEIDGSLSPDGTAFAATEKKWTFPKADTVRFDAEEGYVITKDNGNPAALKLTYTASTGMFKGSFKVFGITEADRSKKYTATVNGGVIGGVGFGTAVIKKVGSIPVGIE